MCVVSVMCAGDSRRTRSYLEGKKICSYEKKYNNFKERTIQNRGLIVVLFYFLFRVDYASSYEKTNFKEENKMREFVKDYMKVCKDYGEFCKKHWKGLVVVNAVLIAGEFVYFLQRLN